MTRKLTTDLSGINSTSSPSAEVSVPSFDHHHNGFGIQTRRPRLSWRFSRPNNDSVTQNWVQTAYDLELDMNSATEILHAKSSQSCLVPWPDRWPELQSRDRGRVRVRCHGVFLRNGATFTEVTAWSPWATFEVALLVNQEWAAYVITASDLVSRNADGSARPLRFMREFHVPNENKVSRARLYITSYGVYYAQINGKAVGDHCMAPGWQSYCKRLHYQVHDVTDLLTTGSQNLISVDVGPGWYASALTWANRRFTYGDELGVLAQIEIDFEERLERLTIPTNSSWTCCHSPIQSSEIYNGEVYDSRLGDSSFVRLSETKVLSANFPQLISPEAPPVRVTHRLRPKQIFRSRTGKPVIDFGQNMAGRVLMKEILKSSGHQIVFRHAEVMIDGELGTRQLRSAKATDVFICNGITITSWHPQFTFHGFRYVEVTGWSPEDQHSPLTLDSIEAEVLHSDMKRTGWFTCGNDGVNRLHENALWSMRSNFLSIPTDDPQRDERLGWTGDLNIFCSTANYLYNTTGVLSNWLEDLYADQMDDDEHWRKGVVPLVVPNCIKKKAEDGPGWGAGWDPMPNGVWGDAAIMVPWQLYLTSGDTEILSQQYPSMLAYLEHGVIRGRDQLWDPEIWQFGDWLDPAAPANDSGRGRTDGTFVADCYLLHSTALFARIAALLDHPDEVHRFSDQSTRLRETFQAKYISPTGLLAPDTPTAYALALSFNLFPSSPSSSNTTAAVQRLIHHLRKTDFQIPTGFVGTLHLLPSLTNHNTNTNNSNNLNSNAAYTLLLSPSTPSLLSPVRMGATTIWERWDALTPDGKVNPGAMTGFNHFALGSVVGWFYGGVAGIRILPVEKGDGGGDGGDDGVLKLMIRPCVHHSIGHCEAVLETRMGRVEVKWRVLAGCCGARGEEKEEVTFVGKEDITCAEKEEFTCVDLEVVIPPNATAKIYLPGKLKQGDEELNFGNGMSAVFGSGRYNFHCRYEQQGEWPVKPLLPPWGRASF